MSIVNKEDLFKVALPEDEVEVEGLGTFKVRGLTRAEVLLVRQGKKETDFVGMECALLVHGLVEPKLTAAEVAQWQRSRPSSEVQLVSDRIAQLSGLTQTAPKEAYKSTGSGQGTGTGVLPSGEAVNDGGSSSSTDAQ